MGWESNRKCMAELAKVRATVSRQLDHASGRPLLS